MIPAHKKHMCFPRPSRRNYRCGANIFDHNNTFVQKVAGHHKRHTLQDSGGKVTNHKPGKGFEKNTNHKPGNSLGKREKPTTTNHNLAGGWFEICGLPQTTNLARASAKHTPANHKAGKSLEKQYKPHITILSFASNKTHQPLTS